MIIMELAKRHLDFLLKRNRIIHPSGCWTTARISLDTYAKMRLAGKTYSSHRVSAYLYLGLDIDDTMAQANHKVECSLPGCWNPDHLYIGTQSDNINDQIKRGTHFNKSKEFCKYGHKFDQLKWKKGKIVARRCSQCRSLRG